MAWYLILLLVFTGFTFFVWYLTKLYVFTYCSINNLGACSPNEFNQLCAESSTYAAVCDTACLETIQVQGNRCDYTYCQRLQPFRTCSSCSQDFNSAECRKDNNWALFCNDNPACFPDRCELDGLCSHPYCTSLEEYGVYVCNTCAQDFFLPECATNLDAQIIYCQTHRATCFDACQKPEASKHAVCDLLFEQLQLNVD